MCSTDSTVLVQGRLDERRFTNRRYTTQENCCHSTSIMYASKCSYTDKVQSVSARVAEELGCQLGQEVGYVPSGKL